MGESDPLFVAAAASGSVGLSPESATERCHFYRPTGNIRKLYD